MKISEIKVGQILRDTRWTEERFRVIKKTTNYILLRAANLEIHEYSKEQCDALRKTAKGILT